jgi:LDH2 family malate/lactate/ureidoglycolate dehydrogenase
LTSYTRINADALRGFIASVFQRLGVPEDGARIAADVIVFADLRGVETHGVNNLPYYVDPLGAGELNPTPDVRIVRDSPVLALMDGDGGLGLVVGVRAMEGCIAKAQERGLAAVVVRRSTHYGAASYYSMMCLEHDMIGVSLTNNAGAGVIPTFGIQPMMETNPISVVAPTDREPDF